MALRLLYHRVMPCLHRVPDPPALTAIAALTYNQRWWKALYDYALDNLNGDGDRTDTRVLKHFLAGSDLSCTLAVTAERDGSSVRLSWCPGEEPAQGVRVTRGGTQLAATAPVSPPESCAYPQENC